MYNYYSAGKKEMRVEAQGDGAMNPFNSIVWKEASFNV
jgi:hypothetical protein